MSTVHWQCRHWTNCGSSVTVLFPTGERPMRIVDLRTMRLEVPLSRPIKTAIHDYRSVGVLLIVVDGGDGLAGESYLFAFDLQRLKVFEEMVLSFRST